MRLNLCALLLAAAHVPAAGFGPAPRFGRAECHRRRVPPPSATFTPRFEATSFAPRSELPGVRSQQRSVRLRLQNAIESQDFTTAALLRDDLAELTSKDPAVVASRLRLELQEHAKRERYDEAARCRDELRSLRRFLPQYSLAGLWKGNYPNHGDELVRLHYDETGDQLFATKLTGDEHVPAGEVTFRADLSAPYEPPIAGIGPRAAADGASKLGVRVEVISLSADGAQDQREVEQFGGEGRIAARGFQHAHYVPGQLFLMDDDVVGFLWLPIGTFVVFTRVPEEETCSPDAAAAAAAAFGLPPTSPPEEDEGEDPVDPGPIFV